MTNETMISNERLEELAKGDLEIWYSESQSMARELLALRNQPVSQRYKLPDGWVALPRKLTADNGAKSALIGEFKEECPSLCPECTGDDDIDDCETCDGSGRIYLEVPVSWTTIKNIWDKAVEHFTPPTDSTT